MGLLIITVIVVTVGFFLFSASLNGSIDADILGGLGGFFGAFAAIALVIELIILASVGCENKTASVKYTQVSQYIDSLATNDQLTDVERSKATTMVIEMNSSILSTRAMHDDPWFGLFYAKKLAMLEPIDIKKIPPAKYQIGIQKE